MVITFTTLLGTSQRAWGQVEKPPCATCETGWNASYFNGFSVCGGENFSERIFCNFRVYYRYTSCGNRCELYVDSINFDNACDQFCTNDYRARINDAIKHLTFTRGGGFPCYTTTNTIAIITSQCYKSKTITTILPGQPPITNKMMVSCGDACCITVYDRSTVPSTLIGQSSTNGNCDEAYISGVALDGVCYHFGCPDLSKTYDKDKPDINISNAKIKINYIYETNNLDITLFSDSKLS